MRYTFDEISVKRTKRGVCSKCGKRRTKTETFMQTLNPFNKRADGAVKSRYEISTEVVAESRAWMALPLVCASCEHEAGRTSTGTRVGLNAKLAPGESRDVTPGDDDSREAAMPRAPVKARGSRASSRRRGTT